MYRIERSRLGGYNYYINGEWAGWCISRQGCVEEINKVLGK